VVLGVCREEQGERGKEGRKVSSGNCAFASSSSNPFSFLIEDLNTNNPNLGGARIYIDISRYAG